MKKTGLLILAMLVMIIVVLTTATYAFYAASNVEFRFTITSESSTSLTFNIDSSSTTLAPAATSSTPNDYSAVSGNEGTYAVFALEYNSTVESSISLYVPTIGFTYGNNNAIETDRANYLQSIVEFGFSAPMASYNLNSVTIPTTWVKYGSSAVNKVQIGAISSSGYILCFVRFNVTEELVPEFYNGVKVSFLVQADIY